jgi:hypothetical protein
LHSQPTTTLTYFRKIQYIASRHMLREPSQLKKLVTFLSHFAQNNILIESAPKASSGILIPPYIDSLAPGVISDPLTGQTLGLGFSISGGGFIPNTALLHNSLIPSYFIYPSTSSYQQTCYTMMLL